MKQSFTIVSTITSTIYWIVLFIYLIIINSVNSNDIVGTWQNPIDVFLFILMIPHLILMLIGIVFSWIAPFKCKISFSLASAILFSIGAVFGAIFIKSFLVTLPLIAFSFIGHVHLKRLRIQPPYENYINNSHNEYEIPCFTQGKII